MQSSRSLNSASNNKESKREQFSSENESKREIFTSRFPVLTEVITWVCRLVFGGTFIYSGFVKAIDPWGTFYKFTEYLSAFGADLISNIVLCGVFGLCAVEFIIGFCILLGCYRKSTPICGLLIMCVMLPLTLWIAVKDPVADCGCFGDALIISNWSTFWKNVILTFLIIWLLKYNRKSYSLITPAIQWIGIVASLCFIGFVIVCGYFRQPLIDFRPYPIGEKIIAEDDEGEPEFIFVYSRNGERKEFGEDDELPSEEEGWQFVERKVKEDTNTSGQSISHKTLRLWDETGDNDMTDDVITEKGKQLLLMIPDLSSVSPATTWKINSLYDQASGHDIDMVAVVAGNSSLITEWSDVSMPQYEIYLAEDTSIKEVARGNPALVYLENGIVKWKTTLSTLDAENFGTPERMKEIADEFTDGFNVLKEASYLYISILAVLIAFSFLPSLQNVFQKRKRKIIKITDNGEALEQELTHDDKAHHAE